jgi:hypothetical protein
MSTPPEVSIFSCFFLNFSVFHVEVEVEVVESKMLNCSLTISGMLRNIAHTKSL